MTRSGGGPRSLAQLVPKLARAAIGRQGFADAGLLTDWAAVAGQEIAAHAIPERLEFGRGERVDGTLHLRVEGPWALAIQHMAPVLIERVNTYYGYGAVGRLKLHQGPLPRRTMESAAPEASPPLDAASRAALDGSLAGIEDPQLRAALDRLGTAVHGRGRPEKGGRQEGN
jgi:hypothetical protein